MDKSPHSAYLGLAGMGLIALVVLLVALQGGFK